MDLTGLDQALPGRPIRTYPALVSTEAEARAWARAGAPEGALVAAGYQASPRGRGGLEWRVEPEDVAFSLVLRPQQLPAEREGWLYVVTACALADVVGDDARLNWPDEVLVDGAHAAAVGVHAELGPKGVDWAILTVLVRDAEQHAGTVARVVSAIEHRYGAPTVPVTGDYLRRCDTIGRRVTARLIPMGPGGVKVTGTARRVLPDGALVVETDDGRRLAVRPQNLGLLDVSP